MTKREKKCNLIISMIKGKGYTNKEFAEKMGISSSNFSSKLSNFRKGRQISLVFFMDIAEELEMSMVEFLSKIDNFTEDELVENEERDEILNLKTIHSTGEPLENIGGCILRKHRIALGLTLKELSNKTGKGIAYLNELEKGRKIFPQKEFGDKLIEILQIKGVDKEILHLYRESRKELVNRILKLELENERLKK